jgi:hypothetical protein
VEATLARIEAHEQEFEELDIADVDIDDPAFEALLVGRKVKVLLGDVDLIRWKQDLIEDRNRLATLHAAAQQVTAARDDKLCKLREIIARSASNPPCEQPRQPQSHCLHRLCRHGDVSLRPAGRMGQVRSRHRIGAGHGLRAQSTDPAASCAKT